MSWLTRIVMIVIALFGIAGCAFAIMVNAPHALTPCGVCVVLSVFALRTYWND